MKNKESVVKSNNRSGSLTLTLEALAAGFWALVAWIEISDTFYEGSKELVKSLITSL